MFSQVITAMKSAQARADARVVYQKLLEDEHLLRDIGVNRTDVRRAMQRR